MATISFEPLKADPCICFHAQKRILQLHTKHGRAFVTSKKDTAILTIYVDDLLPVGQNKVFLKKLEEKLVRRFDTK